MVRRGARINVQQGFVVRVVNEPANAVCLVFAWQPVLAHCRARDGEVDMIRAMSETVIVSKCPGAATQTDFEDEGKPLPALLSLYSWGHGQSVSLLEFPR
jgi:hypothetical protein